MRDIADPYFAEIAKGVTETAAKFGYLALVCNSKRDMDYELSYYDTLRQHNVDGIIIAGGGYQDEEIKEKVNKRVKLSNSLGIKTIALAPQGFEMPYIGVDNRTIGRKMGKYVIDRKHKKVAFIGGDNRIVVNNQRFLGFEETMKKNGVLLEDENIINDEFTWEGGYRSAEKLMERKLDISVICCANDNIAIGVLRYMEETGLNVPKDISVISVGDIVLAEYTSPKLTTVKIPFYEMGQKSVELICGGKKLENLNMRLDVEVIERDSVIDYIE